MLAVDPRWLGLDLRLLSAVRARPWHGNGGPTRLIAEGSIQLALA
jgi:hypothetical protein